MKHIALLCCISLPFLAQAQTSQVHIAGSDYPVVFTDTNLSAQIQQRMAADLTFVFAVAPSLEYLKGTEVETGVFQTRNILPVLAGEDDHIFIVATNNTPSVRIDTFVSDRYLKAFAWTDANSNTVQKARAFVATLNSPDLLSKPTQELLNLYHFAPLTEVYENNPPDAIEIRAYLTTVQAFNYPGFSVLNFYFEEVAAVGTKLPLLFLPMISKADPSKWMALSFGFYKGKWGFGNFPNP